MDMRNIRAGEQGSALVYILIAIALLAALTVAFMGSSSQQTQSQSTFRTVSALTSQIDFVRSAVQECVLAYPGGDIGVPNGPGGDDEGADHRYPIRPASEYYDDETVDHEGFDALSDNLVKNLRCPGNPGDDPDHAAMFSGASGKFMPPAPDLFGDWQWYNGVDGVFFWIESNKSDAFIKSALEKLDESFGNCESDVIDNSTNGSAVDMDSDASTFADCNANSFCFRVWMKPSKTTPSPAVYLDGSGCPA